MTPPIPPLRIRVRLFAMQREAAGMRELRLEVPLGSTVDDAWNAVVDTVPALAPGRSSLRFAVNGEYADDDLTLADGDELACIPPVSGGAGDDEADADAPPDPADRGRPAAAGPRLAAGRRARHGRGRRGRDVHRPDAGHARHARAGPGGRGRAARRPGRRGARLRGVRADGDPRARTRSPTRSRSGSACAGSRSSTAPGVVPLGESSIVVVAVAPHRDAAFAAARYAIDETKARAPIWKAERFEDGVVWIGEAARTSADPG